MKLPSWTQSEIDRKIAQDGCILIIANRFVYDVTDFLSSHPGEEEIIRQKSGGGQDCTADYNFHGPKSRKLWAKYRVARFKERENLKKRTERNIWVRDFVDFCLDFLLRLYYFITNLYNKL